VLGRARASLAPVVVLALALVVVLALAALGCGSRDAPEEAPALSSAASIPAAAPGATGVRFEDPKPYGVATGTSLPSPVEAPSPLAPEPEAPTPLPKTPPPNPFGEPPPVKQTPPKKDGNGGVVGPLQKGVQL